ncbi:hypothetical protein [Nocardioides marmoriginsengisoli]|uniref:hypothetical protein n=1 Tax=Nocardioides marmoriginsengisoli TaxID=661483 RepID=UPI00160B4230|nr:hypothetical protein [Nocardioides marmoriginsengisoli]
MRTRSLLTEAAWLWLPLLVVGFIALGFYRSYLDPGASASGVSLCPQGSHLDQFLGCP